MKSIEVLQYQDPQIVSYEVMEDRSQMDHEYSLSDYGINLFINFNDIDNLPVELSPRIGSGANLNQGILSVLE